MSFVLHFCSKTWEESNRILKMFRLDHQLVINIKTFCFVILHFDCLCGIKENISCRIQDVDDIVKKWKRAKTPNSDSTKQQKEMKLCLDCCNLTNCNMFTYHSCCVKEEPLFFSFSVCLFTSSFIVPEYKNNKGESESEWWWLYSTTLRHHHYFVESSPRR